jgi:phage terminase Nu1 subunit (DNA packaging protein)
MSINRRIKSVIVDEKGSSVLDGLVERADLARDLKVCERTVKRYEDQGLPVIRRGRKRLYDVEKARAWVRGTLRTGRRT